MHAAAILRRVMPDPLLAARPAIRKMAGRAVLLLASLAGSAVAQPLPDTVLQALQLRPELSLDALRRELGGRSAQDETTDFLARSLALDEEF